MRARSKWALLTIAAGSLACAQTCDYSLNPGGQAFTAQGGSGTVTITTGAGCPWSVDNIPAGITLISPASGVGIGSGTLTFQLTPNSGGDLYRSLTIGGQPFIVQQESPAISGLNLIGSMAHLAAQENWTSTFTLVNKSSVSATARLRFFGDAGNPSGNGPLMLPLTFPQLAAGSGPLLAGSFNQTLAANASLILTTAGPQTSPVLVGSAQLAASGAVDGFAIFHQIPTGQEAVVPMETRNASSYLLPFDNTNGLVLGVALENLSGQTANIPVIIRDDAGTVISTPETSVSLVGNGHKAFVLSDAALGFPVTARKRGTIEFDTPTGGRISVLGLRFTPPNNALTTIPALANVGVGGGSIPHLASGGDGWQTTFVLVNTGTTASSATLSFFNDQTGGPVSLPLAFPQMGGTAVTVPSYTAPLAAGASLVIVSSGAPQLITGSAQLTTDGQVSGFVILRHNNQEAVVPLESRNANAYVLAFDNTNGTATGIAVNAVSTHQASVPVVVRDDTGTQIATDTLTLAANGHYAFTLVDKYPVSANIRGTIEFDKPADAQIGAIGIRIPAGAAHTYTTLPALASNPTTVSTTSGVAVSDDFVASTLNRSWTFVNPQGDGVYSLKGASVLLSVPGTASHDPWTSGDNAVRMMQSIANTDFAVEVKFRSTVDKSAPYQEQGIIVEQDATHFLRFNIQSGNLQSFVFIGNVSGTIGTILVNQEIRGGAANYMRLRRTGNSWSFSYSYDSYHWTPAFTFTQTLQVTKIGPFAGNFSFRGQPPPAFTAVVDHFINLVSPPSTVDGTPYPPAPAPPAVQVWYGDSQTFGAPGVPQQCANILGNVSDFNEITSLTYSLNGGPPLPLSMGEDAYRLVDAGDFNAEIDYASLNPGNNTVVITAIDAQGFTTVHGVSLNYVAGQTWPSSYSITSWPTNLQSAGQVVDGLWQAQADGTVRTIQQGYDRLIDIGDRGTWKNYLVTAEVTMNWVDPWAGAVGIVVGWQGHSDVQYGETLTIQPRIGHPYPAFFFYSSSIAGPSALDIWTNTPTVIEKPLATGARTLQTGVKYIFKCQVQQNGSGGSHFSFKVWPANGSEPSAWDVQADGDLSQGSILLGAYRADVTFGQIAITGL